MASFKIPLVFAAEPKPDRLLSLDVSQAREHPDLIDTFAIDTWNSFADCQLFPGDSCRNPQLPRIRDKLAQRLVLFRRNQFKHFALLPFELKEKVWESCLEPVTHTVLFPFELNPTNGRKGNKTWLLESPGNKSDRRVLPVPLWQICQQSRAVANKFYRLLQPGVYFNPLIDTLRLSIISSTKAYLLPFNEPPKAYISCNEFLNNSFIPLETDLSPAEINFNPEGPSTGTVEAKSEYIYEYDVELKTSYKTHLTLHEYSRPYILSHIPRKILQEVQNLELIFYYDPNKPIWSQDPHGHLYYHLLADNCPLLDLTGLRRLFLKVGVLKPPASMFLTDPVAGLDTWRAVIHKLVARGDGKKKDKKGRRTRVPPGLQSLEVAKMCALVDSPSELYPITISRGSAAWYHARRRFLRKLCETRGWQPSCRDIQKSKPTSR